MNGPSEQTKWNLNAFALAKKDKLPGFEKLLNSWSDVHKNFNEASQPDFSWEWEHRERAQVGLLSNATILVGGLSIQESGIKKESGVGNKYSGRSDLWLRLSPPTSKDDYLIEAKQKYLWIDSGLNKSRKVIDKVMDAARVSAQCLKGRKEKVVAMAFLSLSFRDEKLDFFEEKANELIDYIKDRYQSRNDLDAIGAIWMGLKDFDRSRQEREKKYPAWGKNRHFGIVLLASHIMD